MGKKRFGVGIVGLQPGRSWAANAHIPALRELADDYELIGVANTSLESAQAAAEACNIPRAFENVDALIASPDVDLVAVTVKVPHHLEITRAAIEAGKAVYCEWPLGNGLAEARELEALARDKSVVAVVGTQARLSAEVRYLRQMIADGFVGDVLSTSIIGSGQAWGPYVDRANAYLLDKNNGATMLTIPFGHTMAAVQDVLGPVAEVSARLLNRRTSALVMDTGDSEPMTAPDQLLLHGLLSSGAPLSAHYRGGQSRGTGFLWEINGTEGDIQVTADSGHAQMYPLSIRAAQGEDRELQPIQVPESYYGGWPVENAVVRNVGNVYARMAEDLRSGTTTAPGFADAVALHQFIAAVEESAGNGGSSAPVQS